METMESLKSHIKNLIREGRSVDLRIYKAFANYMDATGDWQWLCEITGKSKRTVYYYVRLGHALHQGHLTEDHFLDSTPTALLKQYKEWLNDHPDLTGPMPKGETPSGTLCSSNFRIDRTIRDRWNSILSKLGAEQTANGLRYKEKALVKLIDLIEDLLEEA